MATYQANGQDVKVVKIGVLCRICLAEDDNLSINVMKGNLGMQEHVYGFFGIQVSAYVCSPRAFSYFT